MLQQHLLWLLLVEDDHSLMLLLLVLHLGLLLDYDLGLVVVRLVRRSLVYNDGGRHPRLLRVKLFLLLLLLGLVLQDTPATGCKR